MHHAEREREANIISIVCVLTDDTKIIIIMIIIIIVPSSPSIGAEDRGRAGRVSTSGGGVAEFEVVETAGRPVLVLEPR